MKKHKLLALQIITGFLFAITINHFIVFAWGDNSENGRPSYTAEEVNNGILGDNIVFNCISDSEAIGGSEKNYVAAREYTSEGATKDTIWNANEIYVEDGKTYIIRLFVHNNNPNDIEAIAEDTRVRINVPIVSSRETKVNGYITSSNASPSEYVDDVIFKSDTAFHLEYVKGSALLENSGKANKSQLDDCIVDAKTSSVLIGYDSLDGKIPGGFQYASYVTIRVKAVFDDEFTVEQKVRVVGNEDKEFKYAVNANIGDIVEFQLQYKNISSESHRNVAVRDVLPKSLQYIEGSTKLYNTDCPDGAVAEQDTITTDGVNIGNYAAGANAYVRFRAEVVGDTMADGANELTNWIQVQAGADKQIIIQDYAKVYVTKLSAKTLTPLENVLIILVLICIFFLTLCARKIYKLQHRK